MVANLNYLRYFFLIEISISKKKSNKPFVVALKVIEESFEMSFIRTFTLQRLPNKFQMN